MPYYFVIFVILIAVIVFLYLDNTKLESEINKTKMQAEMRITETHKKCENEKQDLITKHNLQIATLLQQHEKQVQQIREEIENRKTILSQMSEKELLVYDILINCTFFKSYVIIQTRQSEGPLYEIHA